jgi:hypothetical protein
VRRSYILILPLILALSGCSQPSASPAPEIQAMSIEIIDYSLYFEPAGPYTRFSALVVNPNEDVTIESNIISIVALDKNDAVVGQYEAIATFVGPGSNGIVSKDFEGDVRTVELTVEKPTSVAAGVSESFISSSEFSDMELDGWDYYDSGFARASIELPAEPAATQLNVCAGLFSKEGVFLAGDCEIQEVIPGRKNGVSVYVFVPDNAVPRKVQFFGSY